MPTSFRQPVPTDPRTLILNGPGSSAEIRLAVRGLSRSDPDYYATAMLAKLAQVRWQAIYPELMNKPVFVRSETHLLPGIIVMGATVNAKNSTDALLTAQKSLESVLANLATPSEMDRARSEAVAEISGPLARPEATPDPWLDADTFRLKEAQNAVISLQSVTPADVQRVAGRLLSNPSIATVVVGDLFELKPALQGRIQFEVFGEVAPVDTTPKTPVKPGINAKPS